MRVFNKLDIYWLVTFYKAKCTVQWADEHIKMSVDSIALRTVDVTKIRPPARLRQTNPIWPWKDLTFPWCLSENMASSASTSVKPLTILTEDDGVPGSKIEQDPQYYTVDQLKCWLKCRGLKQSGKREEIVQRVASCLQGPNHRVLDVSIDGGKWFAAKVFERERRTEGKGDF